MSQYVLDAIFYRLQSREAYTSRAHTVPTRHVKLLRYLHNIDKKKYKKKSISEKLNEDN